MYLRALFSSSTDVPYLSPSRQLKTVNFTRISTGSVVEMNHLLVQYKYQNIGSPLYNDIFLHLQCPSHPVTTNQY